MLGLRKPVFSVSHNYSPARPESRCGLSVLDHKPSPTHTSLHMAVSTHVRGLGGHLQGQEEATTAWPSSLWLFPQKLLGPGKASILLSP